MSFPDILNPLPQLRSRVAEILGQPFVGDRRLAEFAGTILAAPHFHMDAVTCRSTRRLSRIAKGGGLIVLFGKFCLMGIEPPQLASPPSMAERAIDTATDVSRTIEEITAGLRVAVDRLHAAIESAQRPGQPLARLRTTTREAPLTSLFIAFLLGVAITRRR